MRSRYTASTPGIGGTLTIGANPQRVGIYFQSFPLGTVMTHTPTIQVDGVIVAGLVHTLPRWECTFLSHGDLPTRAFIITTPVGATPLGVIECFLPERYIAAALAEFERTLSK